MVFLRFELSGLPGTTYTLFLCRLLRRNATTTATFRMEERGVLLWDQPGVAPACCSAQSDLILRLAFLHGQWIADHVRWILTPVRPRLQFIFQFHKEPYSSDGHGAFHRYATTMQHHYYMAWRFRACTVVQRHKVTQARTNYTFHLVNHS
jgi:hypothetical protein